MPDIEFRDCLVSTASRELRRGGEVVDVEPKAFELLLYLIEHRDRAVDKNELQDNIWAGTIVTEGALTRCVMKARRAIGDDSPDDPMIKTVRGHGYRFVERVGQEQDADTQALELPNRPSVAVLPFANLSSDPEQEYFSDGITEDIITELSRFSSLFVIGSHSSFSYKGRRMRPRSVARELGVAYIVEGSLQRGAGKIRVNARLLDATTESPLWTERFDRDIADILRVQEEVATTIAATILGRVEAVRSRRKVGDDEIRSYDYLLKAQSLYYRFEKQANAEARELLERAVELDPENSRALAILAAVHSMDSWSFWSEDNERSRELSLLYGDRAIEVDDTDSLALALYAEILFDCGQPERSEMMFKRAVDLNPNDIAAHALYASRLRESGRIDDAVRHIEIAGRLDPFGLLWIPLVRCNIMYSARRYEDAVMAAYSMSHKPVEVSIALVAALAQLGRLNDAAVLLDDARRSAREEMPNYPGDRLQDWHSIIERMFGSTDQGQLDHLYEGLGRAGWN